MVKKKITSSTGATVQQTPSSDVIKSAGVLGMGLSGIRTNFEDLKEAYIREYENKPLFNGGNIVNVDVKPVHNWLSSADAK